MLRDSVFSFLSLHPAVLALVVLAVKVAATIRISVS